MIAPDRDKPGTLSKGTACAQNDHDPAPTGTAVEPGYIRDR
jgi:hypothetical protein